MAIANANWPKFILVGFLLGMPIPSGVNSDYGGHSAAPTGQTPISQVMSPTLGQGYGLKIVSPILPEAEEDTQETGLEASALLPQQHQTFLPKISCDEIGEMNYQGYARKIVTFDYYNHETSSIPLHDDLRQDP